MTSEQKDPLSFSLGALQLFAVHHPAGPCEAARHVTGNNCPRRSPRAVSAAVMNAAAPVTVKTRAVFSDRYPLQLLHKKKEEKKKGGSIKLTSMVQLIIGQSVKSVISAVTGTLGLSSTGNRCASPALNLNWGGKTEGANAINREATNRLSRQLTKKKRRSD